MSPSSLRKQLIPFKSFPLLIPRPAPHLSQLIYLKPRRRYYHPGINHVGFVVASIDTIKKRLLKAGYTEYGMAEKHPYRARIYFYDKTGNEFEFIECFSRKPSEKEFL